MLTFLRTYPKRRWIRLLTFCAGVLFACQTYSPLIAPTPTPINVPTPTFSFVNCEDATDPTQEDIDFSLDYGNGLYELPNWERSYTVESGRVSVSWINNDASAVAYVDYLVFICGYTSPELEEHFSGEYWDILFQNYESYEPVMHCGRFDRGLTLNEFSAISDGYEYQVRYWIRPQTENRVFTMFLVFPVDADSVMNSYAERMFPTLVSCAE